MFLQGQSWHIRQSPEIAIVDLDILGSAVVTVSVHSRMHRGAGIRVLYFHIQHSAIMAEMQEAQIANSLEETRNYL